MNQRNQRYYFKIMEIIGKTKEGFIIEATKNEVSEILNAVTGTNPSEIEIGQKIPAIDYAATIKKIKGLKHNSTISYLFSYSRKVSNVMKDLENKIEAASNLDL